MVLVALAAFVVAEKQDQETAEQFFTTYGYYPSWYTAAPAAVRSYAYSYPSYGYAGYPYAAAYPYAGTYRYASAYPYAATYPAAPFYG